MNQNLTGRPVLFIIAAILALSCGNPKKAEPETAAPPAIPVAVYQVSREDVTGMNTYPGNIVPLNQVELRAEVNGYITGIFVKDGQSVRKGQRLYEIDKSRYTSANMQAQAQVQIAKANLQKVSKDVERYNRLSEQDAIARQRVDYAIADQQAAASQVAAAEASLSNTATDLSRSTIIAPFNGTIGISPVRQGSLVTAGSTLINTISSPDPIAVDFNIGEQEIGRFIKMQANPGQKGDSTFTIGLPDGTTYHLPGRVSAIDRAVDPQTGTIKVRVSFANPSNNLRAGMSCTVRVLNEDNGNLITIPHKAIVEQLGEFFVYLVTDSNKVVQRRIIPGTVTGGKLVVREGLKEGDSIVSDGVQNLREGTIIQVTPSALPAPASK